MLLNLRRYFLRFKKLPWEKQTVWMAGGLALLPILGSLASPWVQGPPPAIADGHSSLDFDTHIPPGYVLVPIEVQNFDSLDSILGPYALVDLFQNQSDASSAVKVVARNVRLLRAPQNPSHFAVLVQESSVDRILRFGDKFTVAIKRRTRDGTEIVKERRNRSITYGG